MMDVTPRETATWDDGPDEGARVDAPRTAHTVISGVLPFRLPPAPLVARRADWVEVRPGLYARASLTVGPVEVATPRARSVGPAPLEAPPSAAADHRDARVAHPTTEPDQAPPAAASVDEDAAVTLTDATATGEVSATGASATEASPVVGSVEPVASVPPADAAPSGATARDRTADAEPVEASSVRVAPVTDESPRATDPMPVPMASSAAPIQGPSVPPSPDAVTPAVDRIFDRVPVTRSAGVPRTVRMFEWGGVAKAVDEAAKDGCRWPLGDARSATFAFCDQPRTGGTSYCDDHRVKAYTPGRSAYRAPARIA